MKPAYDAAYHTDAEAFFRGLCPGLIEADNQARYNSVVRGFSGVYAPASLKPAVADWLAVVHFEFFRGLCPGLIEARRRAC